MWPRLPRRTAAITAALTLTISAGTVLLSRQNTYDVSALRGTIDTGFRPGRDDWQFPNVGSTAANQNLGFGPAMLLTAAWYFTHRPEGDAVRLFGRFNGDGGGPATFWEDDSRALRFVSAVQEDLQTAAASVTPEIVSAKKTPIDVWRDVARAMLSTGEPQVLQAYEVSPDDQRILAIKNLLVYRIVDRRLYVADPIFPGRERMPVELTEDGAFQPYVSKDTAIDKRTSTYNTMTLVTFGPATQQKIRDRWQLFVARHSDNNVFLPYEISTVAADGMRYPLHDGESFAAPIVKLVAATKTFGWSLRVWRDGAWLGDETTEPISLALKPGPNRIGVKVAMPSWRGLLWHDFQYVTLVSTACDLALTPARQYCTAGEPCASPFSVSTRMPLDGIAIDWSVDGVVRRADGPRTIDFIAPDAEGPHYVTAALRERASGRVVCEAEAQVSVQPKRTEEKKPPPPPPPEPITPVTSTITGGNPAFWAAMHACDRIWLELLMMEGDYTATYSDGESHPQQQTAYHLGGQPGVLRPGTPPPVWDGRSFSWRYTTPTSTTEIKGTLSPTGSTIETLTVNETSTFQSGDATSYTEFHGSHTWRLELKNVHLGRWDPDAMRLGGSPASYEGGPNVTANVVKLDDLEITKYAHDPRGNKSGPIERRVTPNNSRWTTNASIEVHFALPTKPPLTLPPSSATPTLASGSPARRR